MEAFPSIGAWIRQRRKVLDLTQAQLAAQVGCAVITVRKIEQELRRPSREMAELLADALAIPAAQRDLFLHMARHEYVETSAVVPITSMAPLASNVILDTTPRTPFVARERELVQLTAHLTSALNGNGRIVFITGEAGYGKTTLMTEFARHALSLYPDLIVAGGNCEAYDGASEPYLSFAEIMALLAGDIDSPTRTSLISREQASRLWALMPYTTRALVEHGAGLINVLVSGDGILRRALAHSPTSDNWWTPLEALLQRKQTPGDLRQRQIFEQYAQVLRALAQRQPLLLLVDDLHWLDHASAGLLLHLAQARRLAGSRILILGSYRPSEVHVIRFEEGALTPHPLMAVLDEIRRYFGDVEVDLGQQGSMTARAFVDTLLDSEPNHLREGFRAALFQRTGGHPLFTVELLRDMQERGVLVQDGEGRWIEGDTLNWETMPTRVEAVISGRISRLSPFLQEALRIASVEGETFTAEVVAHLMGVDPWQMVKQLSSVVDRQHHLVAGLGSQRVGDQTLSRYRFGHVLFQVYLYDSLDDAERTYLHEAVGNTLEQLAAEQPDSVAVQLAHHFQVAGLSAKAIHYLLQAAEQAIAYCAHHAAFVHLTRALTLLDGQPDTLERARQELKAQINLKVALIALKGFASAEVETTMQRVYALGERVGDPRQRVFMLYGMNSVYTVQGDQTAGLKYASQCHELAQTYDDPVLRVTGHSVLGQTVAHIGQVRQARLHLESAIADYATEQHVAYLLLDGIDLGAFSMAHLCHVLWYLGYPDQAVAQAQAAIALANELSHPFSHVAALSYLTMLYQLRRETHAVLNTAQIAARLCEEHDFAYYLAWANLMQGWAMSEQAAQSGVEEGIVCMQHALERIQATGAGLRRPYYLGLLAAAYGKAGRIAEGLTLIDDALVQAHGQQQHLYEAELRRVQGELRQAQGEPDEDVEQSLRRAIDIARQQETKSIELRATTSLARLWQRQGKSHEAQQTLAEVYGWFTEGFETTDLREGETLLAHLAAPHA